MCVVLVYPQAVSLEQFSSTIRNRGLFPPCIAMVVPVKVVANLAVFGEIAG